MKAYRLACFAAFKEQHRHLRLSEPQRVRIDVEYRCHKGADGYQPRDHDNCAGSLKAGIDGLVDARAIWLDSRKWLTWGEVRLLTTAKEVEATGKPAGVTVTVRPT